MQTKECRIAKQHFSKWSRGHHHNAVWDTPPSIIPITP